MFHHRKKIEISSRGDAEYLERVRRRKDRRPSRRERAFHRSRDGHLFCESDHSHPVGHRSMLKRLGNKLLCQACLEKALATKEMKIVGQIGDQRLRTLLRLQEELEEGEGERPNRARSAVT